MFNVLRQGRSEGTRKQNPDTVCIQRYPSDVYRRMYHEKGVPHTADARSLGICRIVSYRINSKYRSSQVSSLMSMNLLQISVTMLTTPW